MNEPNPETEADFTQWRDQNESKMWVKFDLSAARVGWEAAKAFYQAQLDKLPADDAARMRPLSYVDLAEAFAAGVREGQQYPNADNYLIARATDAYTKLVHATKDPEHFSAMG